RAPPLRLALLPHPRPGRGRARGGRGDRGGGRRLDRPLRDLRPARLAREDGAPHEQDARRAMSAWAIFGGSFDPPHVGHVLAVTWVLSTQPVDEVVLVPALEHAFGKPLAPFAHRRRMCELAFAPLRRVRVDPIEAELGGASYT